MLTAAGIVRQVDSPAVFLELGAVSVRTGPRSTLSSNLAMSRLPRVVALVLGAMFSVLSRAGMQAEQATSKVPIKRMTGAMSAVMLPLPPPPPPESVTQSATALYRKYFMVCFSVPKSTVPTMLRPPLAALRRTRTHSPPQIGE
jgi:hypothetical protein